MKRSLRALLSIVLAVSLVPLSAFAAPTPASPSGAIDHIPGVAIVKLKDAKADEVARVAGRNGVRAVDFRRLSPNARQFRVRVPEGVTTGHYLEKLRRDPSVEYAEKDYIRTSTAYPTPNDPDFADAQTLTYGGVPFPYARSWWLRDSGAAGFWANYDNPDALGGFPVRATNDAFKVAVIDTGFYMDHPDKGPNIVAGKDMFSTMQGWVLTTDDDVTPVSASAPNNNQTTAAHGTAVAGQIAAATDNAVGVASVGYDNKVVVYKVQGVWIEGDPGNGYPAGSALMFDTPIIQAIYRAADEGSKVINLSLGGPYYSQALQDAVNYAHSRGAVVVAATGNDGVSTNFYPAACANVVGVGSYELGAGGTRVRSSFTNFGTQLDVLAPGGLIWGLMNPTYDMDGSGSFFRPGYFFWDGTSMASPAFAGLLAMTWRFAPSLSNTEITQYLLSSSRPVGAQPNTDYGYGYVSVADAFNRLKSDYPYLSKPSVSTTKTLYSTGDVSVSWAASSGRAVRYAVARNSVTETTTAGTTWSFSGLGEGSHAVTILPVSEYNWYAAENSTTFDFTVDLTAPVVSDLSYEAGTFTWSDSEGEKPRVTTVGIDSAPSVPVSGRSYSVTPESLSPGMHTFRVRVSDEAGNASEVYSLDFEHVGVVDAPILEPAYTTLSSPFILSWTGDPESDYEYILNGGAIQSATDAALELELLHGVNSLSVRALRGGGVSAWADTAITYVPPLPAPPIVSPVPDTTTPSVGVTWGAVADATSYEYRLNDGSAVTTSATEVMLTGLRKGSNTLAVRGVNISGPGSWTLTEFTFTPPIPGAPSPVAPGIIAGPIVKATWPPVLFATTYDVELNGTVVSEGVAAAEYTLVSLPTGDNAIRVRARSAYGDAGEWSTPIGVRRLIVYTAPTIVPAAVSIRSGGSGAFVARVTSREGLPVAGQPVKFEYSYDGGRWTVLSVVPADVAGYARTTFKPALNGWLRASIPAGGDNPTTIVGGTARVSVKPALGKPRVPTTVRAKRVFTIYGYLKPRHTKGAKNVKIKLYRYRSGRYRYVKTVTATNRAYSSTTTKYVVSTTVPRKGSWRAYPVYAATTRFVATKGPYASFKAR